MLKLAVTLSESFDETTNRFIQENFVLELEHSLVSLSKWESEFEKPFLDSEARTDEEALGYIRAMILNADYPENIFDKLSQKNLDDINAYIGRKMTASWVNESPSSSGPSREKITSELIYYWLVSYQIPWEAENWHLSRLFMLIKIFNAKNENKKPKTPSEIAAERRALNEKRRAQSGSKG